MAYEKDYRKRILNFYYENGKTKTLLQFNISSSTLYELIKLKGIFHQENKKENLSA